MKRDMKNTAEAAISGNREAFGLLYEAYAMDMYRFALSICRNTYDAQDAVHETVLSVFKSIRSVNAPEKFKQYLFSSLSNTCKRKLSHKNEVYEFTDTGANDAELEFSIPVREALDTLDEVSREILMLSVVGGFKSHEIGKIMSIPPATVRTRRKRALEKMRKELSL